MDGCFGLTLILLALGGCLVLGLVGFFKSLTVARRVSLSERRHGEQFDRILALENAVAQLDARLAGAPVEEATAARVPEPEAPVPAPVVPPPVPVEPASSAPPVPKVTVTPAPTRVEPERREEPRDEPVVEPLAATADIGIPPPPFTETAARAAWSFDWESLVGVKLFSALAAIALSIAAVFFLRYSIDHGWLQPQIRMAIGFVTATLLLVACELKAARRYSITANAMDGAAIAILFATVYSAHALWALVGTSTALGLFALVTALAVLLSLRRDSLFIAVLGLASGFATPALLAAREDNPIGLFGYLLLLNAGLAWVATRRRWTVLPALSLALTTLYQWGWVVDRLTEAKLPLAYGIFLSFPIVLVSVYALAERDSDASGRLRQTGLASAVLCLLFAIYTAAVPELGSRLHLLFGYLLIVNAGLLALTLGSVPVAAGLQTRRANAGVLHLAGALGTLVAWWLWFENSYSSSAWPVVLAYLVVFCLFYLASPYVAERVGRPLVGPATLAVYSAPLILFAFPVLVSVEPATASPGALFGTLFLLLLAVSGHAVRRAEGGLHFAGALAGLIAQAMWSGMHLIPERLLPGLGVHLAFALFFIAVPMAARRFGKALTPTVLPGVFLIAAQVLLLFLSMGGTAPFALWALALLLGVLTMGLFVEASATGRPLLAAFGGVVAFAIIATWWWSVPVGTSLGPALGVIALLSVGIVAASFWAARQADGPHTTQFANGVAIGLLGHLFLIFIASQPTLAVLPWPIFGVLAVLDLALGTAALYLRTGTAHVAAMAASQILLFVWVGAAPQAPWPTVAVGAAALVACFAAAWAWLGRRMQLNVVVLDIGIAAAVLLSQTVLVRAGSASGSPALWIQTLAHAVAALAILVVASRIAPAGKATWVPFIVIAQALVAAFARQSIATSARWWEPMLLMGAPYLVFAVYPLLGERPTWRRGPYYAAVAASAAFFVVAGVAIDEGGFRGVIGALPLAQAIVLAALLWRLLRSEPADARDTGRLAFVAGAVLAFVTVAIPLQLETAWLTVAWALEGAALAWLYRRLPHRGLLLVSAALFATVFVRLALNPAVLVYAPHGPRILNWYLYTYLVAAAAMLVGARILESTGDRLATSVRLSMLLPAAATILLFLLLNLEIADFYTEGGALTFNFSGGLAQDLTYTIGWAVFALGLLIVGIVFESRAGRVASLALLTATALKAFIHDLGRLGGLYRVASLVGLAVSLALVSLLLQRFVLRRSTEARA